MMDNSQLLDAVQVLLEGMEKRIDQKMDVRFDAVIRRLDSIDLRLASLDREFAMQAGFIAHLVTWSDKVEDEVIRLSTEMADVRARVAKLEGIHGAA